MNELELWRCSLCKTERTWGQKSPIRHHEGARLNCADCKRMTLHLFTGDTKMVPRENYYYFERRAEA